MTAASLFFRACFGVRFALLARRWSNNTASGVQGGWDLWLDRKRYAQKLCEKDFACQVPDDDSVASSMRFGQPKTMFCAMEPYSR